MSSSVLARPLQCTKGHCALWASNVPFVVCIENKCVCKPLLFEFFSNHLKYLTKQGFTGLLNVIKLIIHSLKQISGENIDVKAELGPQDPDTKV